MGKRKRAKPPPKKAKPKVAQIFDCPFCGKTESCHCKMDVDHSLGTILCDSCGAKYSMRINRLTDPIDVYSEWIDSAPHLRQQHAHTLSIFLFAQPDRYFFARSVGRHQPTGRQRRRGARATAEREREGWGDRMARRGGGQRR